MKPHFLSPLDSPSADADETFHGPAWDNSTEYKSITSPDFQQDMVSFENDIAEIKKLATKLLPLIENATRLSASNHEAIALVADLTRREEEMWTLGSNLDTFVGCELSVDGTLAEQRRLLSRIEKLSSEGSAALAPLSQLLLMAPEGFIEALLTVESMKAHSFNIRSARWFSPHLLSLPEETLLLRMSLNGPTAWGTMYSNISSTLECAVPTPDGIKNMGIASAAGLLQNPNPTQRKDAYDAIVSTWKTQSEACSSVLNALAGWRLDLYEQRSQKVTMSFLDHPLHDSKISPQTLDAMMNAVDENLALGRRAVLLRARALKLDKLGPWDLFAPAPALPGVGEQKRTFTQGLELVTNAFGEIAPEMADFTKMMERNKWIEGRVGNTKRPGAYCTHFRKSRTPRVYMTYRGSNDDIGTLAHELGHAFHAWVMRDLPFAEEMNCPMTLAETASTFAEVLVGENLTSKCNSPAERVHALWADLCNIEALLLNLPARFRFERNFYSQRSQRAFTPTDFCDTMREAWEHYYGDTLCAVNEYFWASKLHFHISGLSFYNFPYTFGFLFSLGIYAQRRTLGSKFFQAYSSLLRDTGRMTAEDVASKHLGADLTKPDFWLASLQIARQKLDEFEKSLCDCGL